MSDTLESIGDKLPANVQAIIYAVALHFEFVGDRRLEAMNVIFEDLREAQLPSFLRFEK